MDREGRRSPAEARRFWELAIDLWSSSGLTVAAFCDREGLKESSFYGWHQRLRKEGSPSKIAATPPAVESTSGEAAIETTIQQSRRRREHSRLSPGAGSLVPVRLVEDAEPVAASEANSKY